MLALAALAVLAHAIHAADPVAEAETGASGPSKPDQPAPQSEAPGTPTPPAILFIPPDRGRPDVRLISGGTRGVPKQRTVLKTLSPRQEGISASAQPTLYWYVSRATDAQIELSVKHDDAIDPLLEIRLPAPTRAGIYSARLADLGLRLEAGKRYEWSVELMQTQRNRKGHPYSSSIVAVSPPDAGLVSGINGAGALDQARLLARSGYWYDAFDTLYVELERHPDPAQVERGLSELLAQVGLEGAGLFER
jgi:hypothetical protein